MSESNCRVTDRLNDTPRFSSASAISVLDLPVVPRSSTRDNRTLAPAASPGSTMAPARSARLIATAGVLRVCFAVTTNPFDSTARIGFRLAVIAAPRRCRLRRPDCYPPPMARRSRSSDSTP